MSRNRAAGQRDIKVIDLVSSDSEDDVQILLDGRRSPVAPNNHGNGLQDRGVGGPQPGRNDAGERYYNRMPYSDDERGRMLQLVVDKVEERGRDEKFIASTNTEKWWKPKRPASSFHNQYRRELLPNLRRYLIRSGIGLDMEPLFPQARELDAQIAALRNQKLRAHMARRPNEPPLPAPLDGQYLRDWWERNEGMRGMMAQRELRAARDR